MDRFYRGKANARYEMKEAIRRFNRDVVMADEVEWDGERASGRRAESHEAATMPLGPDETIHLFEPSEVAEIRAYVAGSFSVLEQPIEDDWREIKLSTGRYADINFHTVRAFGVHQIADAYGVDVDPNTGDRTTNTDEWARIAMKNA